MNALAPSAVLTAALAYAAHGWRIFPCDPHPDKPRSKRPLVGADRDSEGKPIDGSGWPKKASDDPVQIRAWWRQWPDALIGCSPGGTGAFVIDLDPKGEPVEAVEARLVEALGHALPAGARTITQSGGRHLWFRRPVGGPFGNETLGLANIDIRCDNGYVILPPSTLRNGNTYAWEGQAFDERAPELPEGVLRLLAGRKQAVGRLAIGDRPQGVLTPRIIRADEPGDVAVRKYVSGARDKIAADLAGTAKGQRGTALFAAACQLGRFVAGLGMSEREAIALLRDAADTNGLVTTDGMVSVDREIRRGLDFGRSDAAQVVEKLRGIMDEARERAARRENRPPPAMPDSYGLAPASFRVQSDNGQPRVNPPALYRVDDFELFEHSTAFLCRNERDAEVLLNLGFAATAVVGGYRNWSKVLAFDFEGREVFVFGAGASESTSRQMLDDIRGVADSVTPVSIPGGDVAGFVAVNPDAVDRLPALCESTKHEAGRSNSTSTFNAASLAGLPVPPRKWLVPGWIPLETVSAVYGDGAVGKSLLAMQLAVAIVTGREWMGLPTERGRVLIVSAEDDRSEIHRRLADIVRNQGVEFTDLGDLEFYDLAGKDAVVAAPTKNGLLAPTPLWRKIRQAVERIRPVLVVFDTLADTFGGNENDRTQARQYVGLLRGLAIDFGLAALFLAHPSVAGLNSGVGSSGSTGWNNSVRSRILLDRVFDEAKNEANPDARTLRAKKSNYGPINQEVPLFWHHGVFVRGDLPGGGGFGMAAAIHAEQVFLTLVADYQSARRSPSDRPSTNYAPAIFIKDPRATGISKKALEAAMYALFKEGKIKIWIEGPDSRPRRRIVIAEGGDE